MAGSACLQLASSEASEGGLSPWRLRAPLPLVPGQPAEPLVFPAAAKALLMQSQLRGSG